MNMQINRKLMEGDKDSFLRRPFFTQTLIFILLIFVPYELIIPLTYTGVPFVMAISWYGGIEGIFWFNALGLMYMSLVFSACSWLYLTAIIGYFAGKIKKEWVYRLGLLTVIQNSMPVISILLPLLLPMIQISLLLL